MALAAPRGPAYANFSVGGVKQLEEYRPPDMKLRWIDPYGKIMHLPWKSATRWEWVEHPQKLPVKVPALRSWFEIPEGWELALFQSTNMVRVAEPPPAPFSPGRGLVIAFDTQALEARGTLILKDRKGELHEYGMLMEPSFIEPTIMTSDSCLDFNVEITKKRGSAHYLYNAIACELTEDGLEIYVFFSPDAQWGGSKFRGTLTRGNGWIRYEVPMPKADTKIPLGYVKVSDFKNRAATVQTVIFDGDSASRRFRLNVGLSASLMEYSEQPRDIEVTDLGLTAKVIATYTVVPERFEVSCNIFGTALTLSHEPAELETARFLGINARFGWQLPGRFLGGKWQLLTGWYFWHMNVPEESYGIKLLSGPQLFALYRTSHRRSRNLYVYVKYAPIVDTPKNFRFSNNESALGLGYQLTSPSFKMPVFLTLDVAKASFQAFELVNQMTLMTYSAGVSINL